MGIKLPLTHRYITVTYSFTKIEHFQEKNGIWLTTINISSSVDLCSYYTAFEVEKLRTVNYILASSHYARMRGAMLFCPGVTFCSSKQSLKLYESPINKQHKYKHNLKKITRQSLVDVGLSIARPSDLFNDCIHCEFHCYNTADADDQAMQRTRSSSVIVLSHLTWNILISTQEILIFWENGSLNRSVYHLLEMIHYIPSQWPAFQTNSNIPKELKQVTTIEVWFSPRGSDIRKFHPWFWLGTKVSL